jgi:hypothetical protein
MMSLGVEINSALMPCRVMGNEAGVAWFAEQQKARAQAPASPPLGLHVAMGPDVGGMAANLGCNLREGRAGIVQAVLERP